MEVTDSNAKEEPANKTQHGITEVTMQSWHRTWLYTTCKAITHDKLRSVAEGFNEGGKRRKIITIVRIAHYNKTAFCCPDTRDQRGPVAAGSNFD
jgi:hypothetical protein